MTNKLTPTIDQWYRHVDKGQCFCVTVVDPETDSIDVQHFDGDLEEFSTHEWRGLEIEPCAPPEDWSGPLDADNPEDYGTEITNTSPVDRDEEVEEFPRRRSPAEDDETEIDDYAEGFMVEEPDD